MTPIHMLTSVLTSQYITPLAENKDTTHLEETFKKIYEEKKQEVQQVSSTAKLAKDSPKQGFDFSKMSQEDQQDDSHLAMMYYGKLRADMVLGET